MNEQETTTSNAMEVFFAPLFATKTSDFPHIRAESVACPLDTRITSPCVQREPLRRHAS